MAIIKLTSYMTKTTKKVFCEQHPEYKSLRKKDPVQFDVLYNDWVRETNEKNLQISKTLFWLHTLQMRQLGLM